MKNLKTYLLLSLASLLGCITLAGCSIQNPSPSDVMDKFGVNLAKLNSFHYVMDIQVDGDIQSTFSDHISRVVAKLSGDAINKDLTSPHFRLRADILADAPEGRIAIAGNLIGLEEYTYFQLTSLSLPTLLPIALGADSRWYKIKHPAPGEPTAKELGVKEPFALTPTQAKSIKSLLATSPVLEVVEVLPDATISGRRAYHYRVKIKPEELQVMLQEINYILGIKEKVAAPNRLAVYEPEIWIDKRTYNLLKFHLADTYTVEQKDYQFSVNATFSDHNTPITLTPPSNTQDLDAKRLLESQQLPF